MRSRLCSRRLHVSYQAWCEHRRAGLTERRCSHATRGGSKANQAQFSPDFW